MRRSDGLWMRNVWGTVYDTERAVAFHCTIAPTYKIWRLVHSSVTATRHQNHGCIIFESLKSSESYSKFSLKFVVKKAPLSETFSIAV